MTWPGASVASFLLPNGYLNLKAGDAVRLNTPSFAIPSFSEVHVNPIALAALFTIASSRACSAVFDGNGPATLKQSYRHLASSGKLVSYGFHSLLATCAGVANYFKLICEYLRVPRFNPLNMTIDNKSLIAFNLSYLFHRMDLLEEAMGDLLKWVENGKIRAPALQKFPFEKVADAHRALESGKTVGKLILKFVESN